jgi:hypothetical protein
MLIPRGSIADKYQADAAVSAVCKRNLTPPPVRPSHAVPRLACVSVLIAAAEATTTNAALVQAFVRRGAPPQAASDLARRAAAVVRGDLVGVDLLPTECGWTVLELNGAVEFTAAYSLGSDVFDQVARALVGRTATSVSAARTRARA